MLRSLSAASRAAAALPRANAGVSQPQKRHFPICTLDTNLSKSQVPADLGKDLTSIVSVMLNKPVRVVQLILRTDVNMVRAGTTDPTCHLNIWSIDVFKEKKNYQCAKAFMEFLMGKLKLPEERVTVFLLPIDRKDAAHILFGELPK